MGGGGGGGGGIITVLWGYNKQTNKKRERAEVIYTAYLGL